MPFTTLILAAIGTYVWFVEGRAAREWVYAPGGFVSLLTVWHNLRHGEWGLAPRAFLPRLVWTLPVTFRLVLVILGTGAFVGTLHDRRDFLASLAPLVGDIQCCEMPRVPRGDGRAPCLGDTGDEGVAQINWTARSLSVGGELSSGKCRSPVEIQHTVRQGRHSPRARTPPSRCGRNRLTSAEQLSPARSPDQRHG